ncbi:MAG: deoxyribose-phosphate aldolase [candidate division WOR-3 bacterium]|uniref:Deoxyribose-phosphate aldolase n=1 Tax=candidate division WOR-3 bacterium TaxID=2052148 RepID=A0A7C4WA37_UNCW3
MEEIKNFNKYIDHTILRPEATKQEIIQVCQEAIKYNFATCFLPPCYLKLAKEILKDSQVKLGAPISFPFGYQDTEIKVLETKKAIEEGAEEIDMVINISYLKSKEYDKLLEDISRVVEAAKPYGVKVIVETCYLTREEKIKILEIAIKAGCEYIKTSTGFGPKGAELEDIRLFKELAKDKIKIKASGGIRTYLQAKNLIIAGASRIGTSAGVKIMNEYLNLIGREK